MPLTLNDLTLYVNTLDDLYTVNPFTGQISTFITNPNLQGTSPDPANPGQTMQEYLGQANAGSNIIYTDIAMRDDGRLYTFANGLGPLDTATVNGGFTQINPSDATLMDLRSSQIQAFHVDGTRPINDNGTFNFVNDAPDHGVTFQAMAFSNNSYFSSVAFRQWVRHLARRRPHAVCRGRSGPRRL